MSRPPLGELKPGDPVIVTIHRRRTWTEVRAHVVKAAPVWITLEESDSAQPGVWRMRRSTQSAGHGPYDSQFVTIEQYVWDQALTDAQTFLREQGITVRHGSRWHSDAGQIRLAAILRTIAEETP